jgi:hypothetical protein
VGLAVVFLSLSLARAFAGALLVISSNVNSGSTIFSIICVRRLGGYFSTMTVTGGFDFDLCARNAFLQERGVKPPGFKKTGTTISGVIFKVMLWGLRGISCRNTHVKAASVLVHDLVLLLFPLRLHLFRRCGILSRLLTRKVRFSRTALCLEQILDPQRGQLLLTKTVKKFTTSRQTFTAVEQEQQQTLRM